MRSIRQNVSVYTIVVGLFVLGVRTVYPVDCNGNGVEDALDLLPQNFGFLEAQSYPTGGDPGSLISADFNGDGAPDLVSRSGLLLLNQGDGSFSSPVGYGGGGNYLIAADLNGDGELDLATANYNCPDCNPSIPSAVFVLLNRGGGTFHDAVPYEVGEGAWSLITADFNGDGKSDLATANYSVSVLLNQTDGTFEDAVSYADGIIQPQSMIATDLDGDGKPDLTFLASGGVSILLNQGEGTFPDAESYPLGGDSRSLIAADLNGDGVLDLATVEQRSGDISVLLNKGEGTFEDAVSYASGGFNLSAVDLIAADFNGDEKLDLATVASCCGGGCCKSNPPRGVFVLLNQGGGTFRDVVNYPAAIGDNLIAADINGDGKPDLVTTSLGGGDVSVLLNHGDGTFEAAVTVAPGGGPMIVADLNADENLDFVTTQNFNHSGSITVFLNQTVAPVSLDLNRNGIPDECDLLQCPLFHRGDPNSSGTIDISDAIAIFGFLFLGDAAPACNESADVQNDDRIDISDGISLLSWLFANGPAPDAPGPASAPCGVDPDAPGGVGDLGCESYTGC